MLPVTRPLLLLQAAAVAPLLALALSVPEETVADLTAPAPAAASAPAPFALLNSTDSVAAAAVQAAVSGPDLGGLRFLYQNDLDWVRAADPSRAQASYILRTGAARVQDAPAACAALSEQLVSASAALADGGLQRQLAFLASEGSLATGTALWADSGAALKWNGAKLVTASTQPSSALPLCTQSAPISSVAGTDASARWTVEAVKNGSTSSAPPLTWQGYRDSLSFRFGGIPYADVPQRFAPTVVHSQTAGVIQAFATDNSSACPQANGKWQEACNVQNVFTTYLPGRAEKYPKLRPVMLWINGGGFVSGSGQDPNFLGGQLASRSDVVVVTPNYRLGFLGWMAMNSAYPGNNGLNDIITALKWVKKNIKSFGGDPTKVTIFGQSAGAIMVEALLASPAAAGLFHGAIIQSAWPMDQYQVRATTAAAAPAYLRKAAQLGCSSSTGSVDQVVACLRLLPASAFIPASYSDRPVVDGKVLTTKQLDLRPPSTAKGHVNRVPVIMGFMRDELGSLGTVPPLGETLAQSLADANVNSTNARTVLNNPSIFPVVPNTPYGVQNLSVTVATESNSPSRRCGIQATLYALAKNGVMPAVYGYTFDTRAYQIPWYDPNNWCQPTSADALQSGTYGLCHSGDLLPVFNTYGWYGYQYRDAQDLPWSAAIADQWTAFARYKKPVAPASYTSLRGYAPPSAAWLPVKSGSGTGTAAYQMLSLGPQQYMQPLAQEAAQCSAFNLGLSYITNPL